MVEGLGLRAPENLFLLVVSGGRRSGHGKVYAINKL